MELGVGVGVIVAVGVAVDEGVSVIVAVAVGEGTAVFVTVSCAVGGITRAETATASGVCAGVRSSPQPVNKRANTAVKNTFRRHCIRQ